MNRDIADVLKSLISGISYVDKLGGCVQVGYIQQAEISKYADKSDFQFTDMETIKLPILLATAPKYDLYCPDKKRKSIIFFEDEGITVDEITRDWTSYTAKLTLVCWYNMKLINPVPQKSAMIQEILQILVGEQSNSGIFNSIYIENTGQKITGIDIFSKYDIDIAMYQYLMYPYDAFALTFDVSFRNNINCVVPVEIDPINCINNDKTCL